MTTPKEEAIEIRRGKGACCPDCNVHNGRCLPMHNYLIKEAIKRTREECKERYKITRLANIEHRKEISKLQKEKEEYKKLWKSCLEKINKCKTKDKNNWNYELE